MIIQKGVCLLNINSNEEILIVTKNNNKICMPGGKVLDNETDIEALQREVYNQTGCTINESEIMLVYSNFADEDVNYHTLTYISFLNLNINDKSKFVSLEEFTGESANFKLYNIDMINTVLKTINIALLKN